MKNRKVLKHNDDCYLLRGYEENYENFCYYIFSTEGDIIAQDLEGGTCIPSWIEEKYEEYSLEKQHKKDREKFDTWLKDWLNKG